MHVVINFGGYPEMVPEYPSEYFRGIIESYLISIYGQISKNSLKKFIHKIQKKNAIKDKRKQILLRDSEQCVYCKKHLTLETLTLDHIVPKSAGGSNEQHNLCAACAACNVAKSSMPVEEFKLLIKTSGIPKTRNQKIMEKINERRNQSEAVEVSR